MADPIAIIAQDFPKYVIPLIQTAKESISVIVFDWRWYPTISGSSVSLFNAAILAAAARGVDVRCLVNNDGVLKRLTDGGVKAKRLHSKKLLHTKLLIVDGIQIVLGSHNYTQNAFSNNHEASVLVEMSSAENSFVSYFSALYGV